VPTLPLRSPEVLRATYTYLAPIYGTLAPYISSNAHDVGLNHLCGLNGKRVLEVGPGTGHVFQELLKRNPSGWTEGIDVTPRMLARTRCRAASVRHDQFQLRQATITDLPYASNSFDVAFSAYVVDLLPDGHLTGALVELRRVLRPGGQLVLISFGPPQHLSEYLWAAVAHACPPLLGGSRPRSVQTPLRSAGFRITDRTVCRQIGFPSTILSGSPDPE